MDKENDRISKLTFELKTISNEVEANSKKSDAFNADFELKTKQIQTDLADIKNHVETENKGLMEIEGDLKQRLGHCNVLMGELLDRAKLTGKNADRNVIELLIGKYSELILEYDQFIKKYRAELLTNANKFKDHVGLKTEMLGDRMEDNKRQSDAFAIDSQARLREIALEMERLKKEQ